MIEEQIARRKWKNTFTGTDFLAVWGQITLWYMSLSGGRVFTGITGYGGLNAESEPAISIRVLTEERDAANDSD